jgi:hypothetical protein
MNVFAIPVLARLRTSGHEDGISLPAALLRNADRKKRARTREVCEANSEQLDGVARRT